jgi:hypothetical protein
MERLVGIVSRMVPLAVSSGLAVMGVVIVGALVLLAVLLRDA